MPTIYKEIQIFYNQEAEGMEFADSWFNAGFDVHLESKIATIYQIEEDAKGKREWCAKAVYNNYNRITTNH